jgi:hypothetical protein
MKKFIPALLIASVLLAGCTGPFQLTKNLHKWQTTVSEERWVNEAAFLGCILLPPYLVTTLADAIVFNSIEFWGGENPIQKASAPVGNEMCLRSVAEQM